VWECIETLGSSEGFERKKQLLGAIYVYIMHVLGGRGGVIYIDRPRFGQLKKVDREKEMGGWGLLKAMRVGSGIEE
jgi:hypothetical protein